VHSATSPTRRARTSGRSVPRRCSASARSSRRRAPRPPPAPPSLRTRHPLAAALRDVQRGGARHQPNDRQADRRRQCAPRPRAPRKFCTEGTRAAQVRSRCSRRPRCARAGTSLASRSPRSA
jgi:hypothetical protein